MVLSMVQKIVSHTEVEEALEDALKIAESYTHISLADTYESRIRYLCQGGMIGQAEAVLARLKGSLLLDVGCQ
eukprot:Ihof_evm1s1035 gene=Ihof_evmTU1s1035